MLIDIHAHLHVKDYDADRSQTIERARAAGISKIINVGFEVEGNFQALALAKKYDFIYSTMGIHPHLASEWNDDVGAKILKTAKMEDKVVAIGETGLDYYKNFQPRETQEYAFREQLKLAKKLDLPVIIHARDSYDDIFGILDEEKMNRVILHCFTGTLAEAQKGWKRGFYTAFTGIITYPSAGSLREIVKLCPQNLLLAETDCPFLSPQSFRGKRNEPAFLKETFEQIVKIRDTDSSELESKLEENVKRMFGI